MASLVGRRFGPRAGGLVGGLPVVGGPILLVLALQHDAEFGAHAAAASLGGLFATSVFVVVYARLALRAGPIACVLGGWAGFVATIAVLAQFHLPRGVLLAMACGSFLVAGRLLPDFGEPDTPPTLPPSWDIPLRMAIAAALVLAISAASSALGPRASGLLTPFPILTAVLAGFTQQQDGVAAVEASLRGFLVAYFSFAAFSFTASITLTAMPMGAAFGVAVAAAVVTQAVTVFATRA